VNNPEQENRFPKRKTLRLKDYDYSSPGLYFITICCDKRKEMFGKIVNCEMELNQVGRIVDDTWNDLVNHISNIELDYYVIMPEHFHGIVFLRGDEREKHVEGLMGDTSIQGARVGLEPTPTLIDERVGLEPTPTMVGERVGLEPTPTLIDERVGLEPTPTMVGERVGLEPTPTMVGERVGLEPTPTKKISLFEVVRQFKTFSGKRINLLNKTPGISVWQTGYYERIIRKDKELNNIRQYIIENPIKRGIDITTLFDEQNLRQSKTNKSE